MAQGYAIELLGVADGTNPPLKKDGRISIAALRRSRASFNLADAVNHKTNVGDTDLLGSIPEGSAFAYFVITSSVSLGASTIAIGTAANPTKYKPAATFTTPDQPTLAGTAAAIAQAPLTAPEALMLTVGAAALPNAGTLVIDIYYSMR